MPQERRGVALPIAVLILCALGCGPKRLQVVPPPVDSPLHRAEELMRAGCYDCFEAAREVLDAPARQDEAVGVLELRFKLALLKDIRERELGFLDRAPVEPLAARESWLRIASAVPVNAGYYRDTTVERIEQMRALWALRDTEAWSDLERTAPVDPFAAYLLLSAMCSGAESDYDAIQRAVSSLEDAHRGIPLVEYKVATCNTPRGEILEKLWVNDPRFEDAQYFLGRLARVEHRYAEAEARLLGVSEAMPESIAASLALGDLYLVLEEMEACRSVFDGIVAQAPEHRNALLGRARCQGYLGKHEEAATELRGLIALGSVLLGEAHYWLAWNEYQLSQFDDARADADAAMKYQPMDSPTYYLAGLVAFTARDLELAKRRLAHAWELDRSHCEAAFLLGVVLLEQGDFRAAAASYEDAAACFEDRRDELTATVEKLEASPTPERVRSLQNRRRIQLDEARSEAARAREGAERAHAASNPKGAKLTIPRGSAGSRV